MRSSIRCVLALAVLIGTSPVGRAAPVDTLYVDGSCPDSNSDGLCDDGVTYKTIQAAVDAATAGSSIIVGPGTYEEQPEITRNLTLIGTGAGTVVRSPAVLVERFVVGDAHYRPVITVHGAGSVTIQNLVVDGAGRGNANQEFVGIAYHNAGGMLHAVEIRDVRDTPWSSADHGVALYVRNDDDVPRTLAVTSCNAHDFQKNGMVLVGANLIVNVSGNTVTGAGPTDLTVQNGIVAGWGATGVIGPANHVSDLSYADPASYDAATGILVYSDDVTVFSNTVSESEVGIYLWNLGADVRGNSVSASATGTGDGRYWGIVVTIEDTAGQQGGEADGTTRAPSVSLGDGSLDVLPGGTGPQAVEQVTVDVMENDVAGSGDSASAVGLEIDIEVGTAERDLEVSENRVHGWGRGIVLYQRADASLRGPTQTTIAVNQNDIFDNLDYGAYATGFSEHVNAERNWWGDDSGPYDGSDDTAAGGFYNPEGQGDAVSDYLDYVPWVRRTYLVLVMRGVSPPPAGAATGR
jgi:parallel beta-helix repeat protein